MNIEELKSIEDIKAIEPKLEGYELNASGRYLVCIDRPLPAERRMILTNQLKEMFEHAGLTLVGVFDFIPKIFDLKSNAE